jgi:enamine deaminase RidA (YjgF/YER057c/UK114 family)
MILEFDVKIENRLKELGIPLHEPTKVPESFIRVFPFVRVSGNRAWISGHAATNQDGTMFHKIGKVGTEVSKEEAYEYARLIGLAIIAGLKEELGDLDRVKKWVRVFGMVNVAPGFNEMPSVINGFSDLIIDIWGEEAGKHARSAVGVAELPFNIPVEIEAEIELNE